MGFSYMDGPQESSSSSSDWSSGASSGSHSDEEVKILAISCPKRRAGRKIFKETRHPVFRGVRRRNGDKWVCEVREPNKKSRIWLGTYPTPEMAARAHDVAALALRGKSACLNFADSSWRLPVPVSSEAKDIRKAASEAAELFRPQEFGGQGVADDRSTTVEDSIEACSNECTSSICSGDQQNASSSYYNWDEEAMLDWPTLLADMAQGLLLSPPVYNIGEGVDQSDNLETNYGFSLWNY